MTSGQKEQSKRSVEPPRFRLAKLFVLSLDRADAVGLQIVRDQPPGVSLAQAAKKHGISRASGCRIINQLCEGQSSDLPTLEPRIDQSGAQAFEVLGILGNQREPMSPGRSSKERIHNS